MSTQPPRFNYNLVKFKSGGKVARPGTPLTLANRLVMEMLWETGDQKKVAERLGRSPKTIEYHLAAARARLGNSTMSLIDLMRWGVRTGLLGCLVVTTAFAATFAAPYSVYGAKNKTAILSLVPSPSTGGFCTGDGEYQMNATVTITAQPYSGYVFNRWGDGALSPIRQITIRNKNTTYYAYFVRENVPPPPISNYLTNSQAIWNSEPKAALYKLTWSPGSNTLTFNTTFVITSTTNGSNYNVYVQSIDTNGLSSVPSCTVSFTAGNGKTNNCAIQ